MEFKKPIYPIEQWNITETEFKKENNYRNEMTFALSNGYIGTRGTSSSDAIVQLDNEMSQIRDEILDSQNLIRKKDRLVSEILNLIHNLYRVANKREVLTIQDEFYKVYQQGDISMLEKFLQDLDLIAESYRAQEIDGDI